MPIFDSIEQISNHGSVQGIIPRFFTQMNDMMTFAYGDEDGKKRSALQFQLVITDFTSFYDLFEEIKETFDTYKKGVQSGEFCKTDSQGVLQINRIKENKLNQLIKDFFIRGRLLLNNWAKSKVIDNELFKLNDLVIVKDSNFIKNSKSQLEKDEISRYENVYNAISKARNEFLTEFNQVRADYEHSNFKLPKFQIGIENDIIQFAEPKLLGHNLMSVIDYFYGSILNFVEI